MSRYISKLPEPIRALAEKRRSDQFYDDDDDLTWAFNWEVTPEGYEFWLEIKKENYSVFYDLYPQRDKICTCNSRTVDETFSNVIHSDECELSGNTHDKLDELIEWMESELEFLIIAEADLLRIDIMEKCLTKAKEIKNK